MDLQQKENNLLTSLKNLGKALVAFSGGVDSTFLAAMAYKSLGKKVIAVTLQTEYVPEREIIEAEELARSIGIDHQTIKLNTLQNRSIASNPPDRCYYCKNDLFSYLKQVAKDMQIETILDGSNTDDMKDFRPGLRALRDLNIVSPLKDAGLSKDDIRELSKKYNLPTWSKASFSCLATRIPYGDVLTKDKIRKIDEAENILYHLGFSQFRVRYHGNIARIEILPVDFEKLIEINDKISREFANIGFDYVTLDLHGYQSGSLNELLKKAE